MSSSFSWLTSFDRNSIRVSVSWLEFPPTRLFLSLSLFPKHIERNENLLSYVILRVSRNLFPSISLCCRICLSSHHLSMLISLYDFFFFFWGREKYTAVLIILVWNLATAVDKRKREENGHLVITSCYQRRGEFIRKFPRSPVEATEKTLRVRRKKNFQMTDRFLSKLPLTLVSLMGSHSFSFPLILLFTLITRYLSWRNKWRKPKVEHEPLKEVPVPSSWSSSSSDFRTKRERETERQAVVEMILRWYFLPDFFPLPFWSWKSRRGRDVVLCENDRL